MAVLYSDDLWLRRQQDSVRQALFVIDQLRGNTRFDTFTAKQCVTRQAKPEYL